MESFYLSNIFFSEENYDQFCLAYMFTYRDFEGGTLGLAWTGDLKNAGGVCEKNGVSGGIHQTRGNIMPQDTKDFILDKIVASISEKGYYLL